MMMCVEGLETLWLLLTQCIGTVNPGCVVGGIGMHVKVCVSGR